MADGVFAPSLIPFERGDTPQANPARPERSLVDAIITASGPLSNEQPIEIRSQNRGGTRAASFFDDYYNRVHIIPSVIGLGPVASSTDRAVSLWNAYLTTTSLTGISNAQDGVVISGTVTPVAVPPLGVLTLNAHVNESGPATIDASFTFSFNTSDVLTLAVTGTRARLWPFRPNWRVPVSVVHEYRTDMVTSRSGREQRRALRATPRQSIGYTITVDRAERQKLTQILTQWQSRPIVMGDPTRKLVLDTGSPADSGLLTVAEPPVWMTPGAQVTIDTAAGINLATITVVEDGLVEFTPANDAALPAGTIIRPGVTGLLAGTINAEHPTNRVAEASIRFAIDPGSETVEEGEPGVYVHGGREVFTLRPNWASSVEQAFDWPVEQVDFGYGRIRTYHPIEQGWFAQSASFVGADEETIDEVKSFVQRQRGRRGEFHMPTWMDDITLRSDLVSGTSLLRAAGTDLYDNFNQDTRYRTFMLRLSDGRVVLRTITGMYPISDGLGTDTVLELDEPWLGDIAASDVLFVCWAPVFRFASDEVTFEYPVEGVAQVQLGMRSLEELPAESPITELDGAARWVLENWGVYLFDDLDWAVNVRYPAIFWHALPWVMVNEKVVDQFDAFVNIEIPESLA